MARKEQSSAAVNAHRGAFAALRAMQDELELAVKERRTMKYG